MGTKQKGRSYVWLYIIVWIIILSISWIVDSPIAFLEKYPYSALFSGEIQSSIQNGIRDGIQDVTIETIDDIPAETMEAIQRFTLEDLEAKKAQGSLLARHIFQKKYGVDLWYISNTDVNEISDPELETIYLLRSKRNKKSGVIVLLYSFDVHLHWPDDYSNYPGTDISETVYTCYVYDIDLSNLDMPISDYSAYSSDIDARQQSIDSENWYLTHIASKKDVYDIEERKISKTN